MEACIYKKPYKLMEEVYDVIVIGGGTAGSAAAIAAALEGAHTLIVERNSYLGGTATGGQVTPMMHNGIDARLGRSYINEIIKHRMTKEGYNADDKCGNDGWFNTEMLKFTLEDIFTENKGRILYNTELIDTVVEANKLIGILVHNKSGLFLIHGGIFIDCTGDGDAANYSGVPCFAGDGQFHRNQSMSLRFMTGNIDIVKLKNFLKDIGETDILEYPFVEIMSEWKQETPLCKLLKKGLENKVLKYEDGIYVQAFSVPGMPGVMSFNCPEIPDSYDALNMEAVSQALTTGRKMIKRLFDFLTLYIPGFEESFIMSVAEMPGIRESRRISGKYLLSEEDYASRAKFADGIAKTAYPIDIHGHSDKFGLKQMEPGEYFEIPFRCMVTDNIENLIVAGRCISATFTAQSCIRIQPTCREMGEAAGIAAAYCSKNNRAVNNLDGSIVRSIMREHSFQNAL